MTSTQRFPCIISKKINRDNKKYPFSKRGLQSVFFQRHSSRTSYHARTDWLQYQVNIVTIVTVNFQQKINIVINDWLDYQIVLCFSACTQYSKWCISCVVSYFCARNIFKHGNSIKSDMYKISDTNQTIIVIILIHSTYLSKWCTTIPND